MTILAPVTVVLDTNIWISGVFFGRGPAAQTLKAWRDGRVEVVVSPETLLELETKLHEKAKLFGFPATLADEWIVYINTFARAVAMSGTVIGICRDAKDDKFLDTAVSGNAAYLVTGDKDLLVLQRFQAVEIISHRNFIEIMG